MTFLTGKQAELAVCLDAALESDHPCGDPSCDIAKAREAGYVFSAAHLLLGATECPNVDQVLADASFGGLAAEVMEGNDGWPIDWDAWVEEHKRSGVKCEACGALTYGDDYWTPEECGNCLQPL